MESSTYTMPIDSDQTIIRTSHLRGVVISQALTNNVKIYDGDDTGTLLFSAVATTAPNSWDFNNIKVANGYITVDLDGNDTGFVTILTD